MAKVRPTVIIKPKPKAKTATFVKRDPVPDTINEPYLVDALNAMHYGLFGELPNARPLPTINKLLQHLGSDLVVPDGCGVQYLRDSLAILTDIYNQHGEGKNA